MKTLFISATIVAALFAAGCGKLIPDGGFVLEIPELPPHWEQMLGTPHWRIEYADASERKAARSLYPGEKAVLDLPQTWTSAVLAYPYWPEWGINAGTFKPAGALFPFDVSVDSGGGGSIRASWRGGVDAFLYWELARAAQTEAAALQAKVPRLPSNFNWPRFRDLMAEDIAEEIRTDPWLADWSGIAAKTAQSGFDKRRIVIETRRNLTLSVPSGHWIGVSPFAAPLIFAAGEPAEFPVREEIGLWVSGAGILRANTHVWVFWEWP